MKVAQVTPYYLPVEGGVERHVFNLSKGLARLGHEVTIFTCSSTRHGEPLEARSVVDGIEVRRFESVLALGEFGRVWPGFAREVLDGGFDVVHSHAFRHPHTDISMLVSKFSGSASVLTTHSPFHPSDVRRPFARTLVSVYDRMVAPTTLGYFDRIISLTEEEASILRRMGVPRDRTTVIPHGVDPVQFDRKDPSIFTKRYGLEGRDIVLSLGRINRTKGLHVLLESFSRIAEVFPQLSLVIAGGCTSQQEEAFLFELREMTAAKGLQDRVVFTGKLTEEEKASAFEACTVFVLPSLYEPYGIVLLEAAAHGRPIIATAAGGPVSIFTDGHDGLLVPPGDAEALAASLLRVVTDRAAAAVIGGRAREMARNYTWESVAERTEVVYKGLVKRSLKAGVRQ